MKIILITVLLLANAAFVYPQEKPSLFEMTKVEIPVAPDAKYLDKNYLVKVEYPRNMVKEHIVNLSKLGEKHAIAVSDSLVLEAVLYNHADYYWLEHELYARAEVIKTKGGLRIYIPKREWSYDIVRARNYKDLGFEINAFKPVKIIVKYIDVSDKVLDARLR